MDKMSIISGALFFAANVFAVTALALPDWIITEVTTSNEDLALVIFGLPDSDPTYNTRYNL